ncbi:hypothetical protein [Arthrobacter sp. Helios]|uniref:hypothetical protein n=1 Tax=Arthrobacter sp. Helios TaxID=2828862 RepID=UPI00205D952B|nr:hypothetical protein [Arthrobacter sp. Helios]UPO77344.1 hypothetical protein ArtHe_01055 [Arthrobacter sp. Helios]
MGNHTDSDDYRLYARPQDGQAQDSAQIVDDGGPAPSAGRAGGARTGGGRGDSAAGADGDGGDGDRTAANIAAARRSSGGSGSGNGTSGRQADSARADGFVWAEDTGDPTGADGVQRPEAPGGFAASDGFRRFNPYLCAAWALVAIMLAAGLSWLTGALEPPTYVSVDPSTGQGMEGRPGVIASNLYSMGPFVLLFGLLGALTLLTVQAAAFRRRYGR